MVQFTEKAAHPCKESRTLRRREVKCSACTDYAVKLEKVVLLFFQQINLMGHICPSKPEHRQSNQAVLMEKGNALTTKYIKYRNKLL